MVVDHIGLKDPESGAESVFLRQAQRPVNQAFCTAFRNCDRKILVSDHIQKNHRPAFLQQTVFRPFFRKPSAAVETVGGTVFFNAFFSVEKYKFDSAGQLPFIFLQRRDHAEQRRNTGCAVVGSLKILDEIESLDIVMRGDENEFSAFAGNFRDDIVEQNVAVERPFLKFMTTAPEFR